MCSQDCAGPPGERPRRLLNMPAALAAAAALAASADARDFAAAAEDAPRTNANEDAALGYMMSRVPHVSYVRPHGPE